MENKGIKNLITLIFKAIALAMGVAVTALMIMGKIDTNSALTLLGIGLAGAGGALLIDRGDK